MCPLFDPFRWACVVCVLYVLSNVLRINFFSCPAQSTEVKLLVVILVAGGVCKFWRNESTCVVASHYGSVNQAEMSVNLLPLSVVGELYFKARVTKFPCCPVELKQLCEFSHIFRVNILWCGSHCGSDGTLWLWRTAFVVFWVTLNLSLIHIWRCRRSTLCRSRWSPYH